MNKEDIIKIAYEYHQKSAKRLGEEMGYKPDTIRSMACRLRKAGVDVYKGRKPDEFNAAVAEMLNPPNKKV